MRFLRTRTIANELLSTRKMTEDGSKYMNNANEVLKHMHNDQ